MRWHEYVLYDVSHLFLFEHL